MDIQTDDLGPSAADALERDPVCLLVEDEDELRRGYEKHLEKAGFTVRSVDTIAAARGLLASPERVFDVAILDFGLPDGSSLQLVTELLERTPLCKSLVVTGVAGTAEAHELVRAGAHTFLEKPVSPGTLISSVVATLYATLRWRQRVGHAEVPTREPPGDLEHREWTDAEPPMLQLDPLKVLARLRYIGGLSARETVVAYRLLWGDTDRQIGAFIGCAERTAKRHVSRVLAKIGAPARSGVLGALMRDAGYDDESQRRR